MIATAKRLAYEQFQIVTTDGSCSVPGMKAIPEARFSPEAYTEWDCIVAIGNNTHRRRFHRDYPQLRFTSIIARSAEVDPTASIGCGSYVGAFAFIGPDSTLGEGTIVNTHGIIGHDAKLGAFSQVGPRACLCGHVELGRNVFVGAGAILNNGSESAPLHVADQVHVGMGCLVTHPVRQPGLRLVPKANTTRLRGETRSEK